MAVDFASTSVSTNVQRGDTGIMNLVIKNSGGRKAENINVWVPGTAVVFADKRYYVGSMDSGETRSIPVIFRISPTARTGMTGLQVKIVFDGYRYDGTLNPNQQSTFEIPVNIISNPLFQITPDKTTFYKDNLDDLTLMGISKDPVRDLEATLTSNCLTVMGSSRKYVGLVTANQTFGIPYAIKPSQAGSCLSFLTMSYTDESGGKSSDNISIGLNVQDAGVDFKVQNVSYTPTGPGEQTNLKISLRNVGNADASDVTFRLNITSPFAPIDTTEKYIPKVNAGGNVEIDFGLSVGWDAITQAYSIPLSIAYKVGGSSYSTGKDIGLDVAGKVILEVMDVQTSSGSVRIDVANIGTRTADGVKATLIIPNAASTQQGRNFTGRNQISGNASGGSGDFQRLISYKSDIKSTKQTTFTFPTTSTGQATLEIEYSGPNNQRVTQTERITIAGSSSTLTGRSTTSSGTSTTTYALYAVVLVIAYLAYRRYKAGKK